MQVNGHEIRPGAYLGGANLQGTNLQGANLGHAYLGHAYLGDANLQGANLQGAYLQGANLQGADLRGADLQGANLRGANLRGANLRGADLRGADLRGANLRGARLPAYQIPAGDLIVYKKILGDRIIKLLIPSRARRTASLVGRKCRAEFAVVIEGDGLSVFDHVTTYKPDATVYPDSYDDDPRVECSHGIHFFLTREEAERYCA